MSSNVKFLLGSEEGEKEEFIEKEKTRLRGQYPDLEVKTVFAFDSDVSQLQDALFSPSLFTSFTLVILKHYEEVKKDSQINRIILRFISEDNPSAYLLVLSTGTSYNLPQSISKALGKDETDANHQRHLGRRKPFGRELVCEKLCGQAYAFAPQQVLQIVRFPHKITEMVCG